MYDAIDDPYTYENSTVLVNKLDLRDQDELDAFEAEISNARSGAMPRVTAKPPQNGSTNRRSECGLHSGKRCGTSQRFPPAHLRGGRAGAFNASSPV